MDTVDKIRQLLGGVSEKIVSDELLQELLAMNDEDITQTAAAAAQIVGRHYALKATRAIGDTRIEYNRQAELWMDIAKEMEERAAGLARPFFGGTSKIQKELEEADEDRPQSDFWRGMFEGGDLDD